MATHGDEKQTSARSTLVNFISIFQKVYYHFVIRCFMIEQPKEREIQLLVQYWLRTLKIKLGWINDFDNLVVHYVMSFCYIDYSIFDDNQFMYSGSNDKTIRVWDVDNNKQMQSFNGHSKAVGCVKFSQYHYRIHRRHVICSSSDDKTIRFWDIKNNQQFQIFDKHTSWVNSIVFSPFNSGRYLCSGSGDITIRLWDVETYNSLHVFNGHESRVWCVDISPLQSNNNNNDNKMNNIGVIGGNGYTICSGSSDATIRIWDIETTKQLNVFKGHEYTLNDVKYGSNELVNTILSGSWDKSVRLWDIRSGQQIQKFNGHEDTVSCVEYSPLAVDNLKLVVVQMSYVLDQLIIQFDFGIFDQIRMNYMCLREMKK
ncbi:hypothetical protein RFI_26776 [Reticulomyxa filosa]|uniref:Uncharacterized protein n=1 Tax=Reticulomyxa filosa TaxID=46433 RepID=X6MAA0_RETFI|nr:hypothetical protein RFI_26776 [Reticulomyxa filosa]|eukprot:ETO10601.1 hypothetical protein RFI_26776 [Reticulomyxa filosa]